MGSGVEQYCTRKTCRRSNSFPEMIMMFRIALIVILASQTLGNAQEWSRFRGPNGTGVRDVKGLPTSWTEKDFEWTVKLPGRGHSSPVVWGEKIFVTSAETNGKRNLICINADKGEIAWTRSLPGDKYKMHARNSGATSTPVVDQSRVYLLSATPKATVVDAFDHAGERVWNVDLGPFHGNHGIGVSPILVDDVLILALDQDERGKLLALDARTGRKLWDIPRQSGNASYATPCVYQPAGQPPRVIFTNWKHGITAVDPKSGVVAWEVSVFDTTKQERSIVSPIIVGDLIVGTCSFTTAQKHFVAVRPTSQGRAEEIWRLEKSVSHLPTPLVVGDHIYIVTEKGVASCLDGRSGTAIWQERFDNEFSASPVCANGVIYATADDGEVVVFRATSKFELIARNSLGRPSQATPAIARDRMIFRTDGTIMSLRANREMPGQVTP